MALFLEGDKPDIPIGAERVVPDLVAKLPGLFGEDAPFNIVRASVLGKEGVNFFPRRTNHPFTYAAVHAETGSAFDGLDIEAHTSIFGNGWQTEVRGRIHGEPGFEAWWEGDMGEQNSRRVSFMWADNMPSVMIDTRHQIVFPGLEVHGASPIGVVEFMKRRGGKRNRWLEQVYGEYPVEPQNLRIRPDHNSISALLTPRDKTRQPFIMFLPLVLETHLRHGVPNRMMMG